MRLRILYYFIPFIATTVIITMLSLLNISNMGLNLKMFSWDKFWHALFYAIYNGTLFFALIKIKRLNVFYLIVSSIFIIMYGAFMEYLQFALTTYRCYDYYDMLANAFGAIIPALFVFYFYFRH